MTTDEMITAAQQGATLTQIASQSGMSKNAVYHRLYRKGVTPASKEPLRGAACRGVRHRIGVRVGRVDMMSHDVQERIMDVACRKSITLWEAVDQMLGENE